MELSNTQLQELLIEQTKEPKRLKELMTFLFESLMKSERHAFLQESESYDKANGYRSGTCYGSFGQLVLRIPRVRYGGFHPVIYGILRAQEEEAHRLAHALYCKGLSNQEVANIFEEVFEKQYHRSTISRIVTQSREEVQTWLMRPLSTHYPILLVDALYTKVRRSAQVEQEAFYTVLGVLSDGTREVLGIFSIPTESATGWQIVFESLKQRGLQHVDLVIADGLTGLEQVVSHVFGPIPFQKCVTHLKRRLLGQVRTSDRARLAHELRTVFLTNILGYTQEEAWQHWICLCQRWKETYRYFEQAMQRDLYGAYFTYLRFPPTIQSMIYTTNWMERLQRSFRRTLKIRAVMPSPEAVLHLMVMTAMDRRNFTYPIHALKNIFSATGHLHPIG